MVRLVLAQLRRLRRESWVLLMVGVGGMLSSSPMAARMNAAVGALMIASSCTTLGLFWGREMRILPLRPREARRSAWLALLSLVAALQTIRVLTLAALGVLGAEWSQTTGEQLALLALFDVLYVSASFALYDRPDAVSPAAKLFSVTGIVIWVLLPFAAAEVLPRNLDDFRWWNWIALIGLTALALCPLLVDRDEWPRLGIVRHRRTPEDPLPSVPRLALVERLSGFWRLVPSWAPGPLITATLALAPLALGMYELGLAPMSRAWSDVDFLVLGGPLFLTIAGPFSSGTGLEPWLRRLKVLPISGRTLVAIATLLPCRAVLVLWLLAAVLHAAQTGSAPETLRLGAMCAACGLIALGGAFRSRFNQISGAFVSFTPVLLIILLWRVGHWIGIQLSTDALLPVIGVLTGAAAVAVNHRTLNCSSSQAVVYRPFGQAA